jgi:hypothetical protein
VSKFLARRELGKLVPVDQAGEDALRKLKFGDVVSVEVKKPRNVKHHRLYWQLVSTVLENQTRYETAEQLHCALKISAGIYDPLIMPSGVIYKIPGSIAFDKMDQTEFKQFYDKVCDLVAEHFLPGIDVAALKEEVESLIGVRP